MTCACNYASWCVVLPSRKRFLRANDCLPRTSGSTELENFDARPAGAPWRDLLQAMRTDAGHAAVALARGCRIDDVAIAPVAEVNFTYRRYATYVMVAPAGTIAQLRARPGSPRRDDVDFARAYEAAARIGNPRQVFKQLWPKTKELVALRWHQVDVIAALLLRYEKLTGSQLNKVLIRPPRRRVARVVRGRQRPKANMRQRWLAQSG